GTPADGKTPPQHWEQPSCSCGIHPAICPSVHPSLSPADCPAPLAGWGLPPSACLASPDGPGPSPHTPTMGPEYPGCEEHASWGGRNLLPDLGPPHAVLYPLSLPRTLVLGARLFVSRCDRSINILFFVLDIWG
ncbi:unnamed protein product, partial [Gulo gulo]